MFEIKEGAKFTYEQNQNNARLEKVKCHYL